MRLFTLKSLLASALVLLLAACVEMPTAPKATMDYNHSYDFGRVHKIAIQPITRDTLETMLISDQQITRVNQALITELTRRGFEVATRNIDADIFLSWRFVPQESADVATVDPGTQPITRGMLYVSMVDPITLQAVWRASFASDMSEPLDTAAAAQYRQSVAEAMLAQFPPPAAAH